MRRTADYIIGTLQKNYSRYPKFMADALKVAGYTRDKLDKEPSIIVSSLLHNYGKVCVKDGKTPFTALEQSRAYFTLKSLGFPQEVIIPIYNLVVPEEYFWTGKVSDYTPFHDGVDKRYYTDTLILRTSISNSKYYRVSEKNIYDYYDYIKYVLAQTY